MINLLNKTNKDSDILIGSPFIAVLNYRRKFDKFFVIDENPDYASALEKRLKGLAIQNSKVFKGKDCNTEIDNILKEINKHKNKHIFFFIDPYAMEIQWDAMVKILKTRSDIIFTFMTTKCPKIVNFIF